MNKKQRISILVENETGKNMIQVDVLARIIAFFSLRNFEIESISVVPDIEKNFYKIEIVIHVDDQGMDLIKKQLRKLIQVLDIQTLNFWGEPNIERELVLIKIKAPDSIRKQILETSIRLGGRIIRKHPDFIILEIIGQSQDINMAIKMLGCYEILDMTRTGAVALRDC